MDGLGKVFGQPEEDAATASVEGGARGRDSLLLVATVRFGDDPTTAEVRVRNLSAGGMMVEHTDPVAVGTAAAMELRGVGRVAGRVAWCTQGRIGIALDQPIDPRRARKPVAGGTKTPAYAKSAITPMRRR